MSADKIILGTRGSELALCQTEMVVQLLSERHPHLPIERRIIATTGDKRPDLRLADFSKGEQPVVDKGIFVKELENALDAGEIDAAVHSLKDVPSDLPARFVIAAVLPRAAVEDVLITREPHTLESLPEGARVGTSSVRRARQLKWLRPDIEIVEIRGNVPTRVRKLVESAELDAVLLASAGLLRLGLLHSNLARIHINSHTLHALVLDAAKFFPAAGQGAIAIEARVDDQRVLALLSGIDHAETHIRVTAEREFLRLLGAGCQTPVGAHTWIKDGQLHMAVRVFSEKDPSAPPVEASASNGVSNPERLAKTLAGIIQNEA